MEEVSIDRCLSQYHTSLEIRTIRLNKQ